ncbi:hypothetical protein [Allokutzneria sp. NRRL B-24872]|uniref:hypothetical protein n=1 Tax=Allokutzneria sp. NRRL B-24872 TaxID=1137961 RepID=UPI001FEF6AB4|nr:hypothetical protein [Allokutzneria sp. NRRL B-24872]
MSHTVLGRRATAVISWSPCSGGRVSVIVATIAPSSSNTHEAQALARRRGTVTS